MKKLVTFIVLVLAALPALAKGKTSFCSTAFPNGIRGAIRVYSFYTIANSPNTRIVVDEQIWSERSAQLFREMLSAKAGSGALQFSYVEGRAPYDLMLNVILYGRGQDEQGHPTAYWGDVWARGMGKGILFHFTTHAVEPHGEWHTQIVHEAADTAFGYLANGWTCER